MTVRASSRVPAMVVGIATNDGANAPWEHSVCWPPDFVAQWLCASRASPVFGVPRIPSEISEKRRIDLFALTGQLTLAGGRFMSIGWSGKGDGLVRFGETSADELGAVASAVERAEPAVLGETPAILDYQPAALLVHEAIGHFAEASASPELRLDGRVGCLLAAEWMTAQDDPRLGEAADYVFDDEGIKSMGPTVLLRSGRLSAQLHSTASALRAGALSTASARSAQVAQPAIPRISNLTVGGGNSDLNEMIEHLADGLYIRQLSHGFSRGSYVEARLVLAERVRNGKRTGVFVSGGRVIERADLFLRACEATTTTRLNPNAMCGKYGQILYDVGTIAPAIRMTSLRLAA